MLYSHGIKRHIQLYFRSEVIAEKNCVGWNFSRTFQARITTLYMCLSGTISPTNVSDMTSRAVSGRVRKMQLNTAQSTRKKLVRPAKSQIIRPLFNIESPNFARTSRPTCSAAKPDITKFEERPKCYTKLAPSLSRKPSNCFFFQINIIYQSVFELWEGKEKVSRWIGRLHAHWRFCRLCRKPLRPGCVPKG